jgi:hypothetical protein
MIYVPPRPLQFTIANSHSRGDFALKLLKYSYALSHLDYL